jgi:hypothetical protein
VDTGTSMITGPTDDLFSVLSNFHWFTKKKKKLMFATIAPILINYPRLLLWLIQSNMKWNQRNILWSTKNKTRKVSPKMTTQMNLLN